MSLWQLQVRWCALCLQSVSLLMIQWEAKPFPCPKCCRAWGFTITVKDLCNLLAIFMSLFCNHVLFDILLSTLLNAFIAK